MRPHARRTDCTILIVDDEPTILRMLTRVLSQLDCRVLTAYDAEAALQILQATSADVIIADIRLPGMDGVELTRRIKASRGETTVLLISAYREPSGHTADGFIAKPFDNEEVLALVQSHLPGGPKNGAPPSLTHGGQWPLQTSF